MRNNQGRVRDAIGVVIVSVVVACSVEDSAGSPTGLGESPFTDMNSSPATQLPTATAIPPADEPATPTPYAPPVIPYPHDVRPALQYPDLESHGAVRISFTSPQQPPTVGAMSCLWAPRTVDGELVTSNPTVVDLRGPSVVLAGEPVDIWLGREWPHTFESAFTIHRHGAASYVEGPGTGSVEGDNMAPDRSSGRIHFDSLAPSAATAHSPEISIDDWVRPLGGDPSMGMLTGTVEWACEPPPLTFEVDAAICGNGPSLLCLGDPGPVVLVVNDQRLRGVNRCGSAPGDTCGPSVYSLPLDSIVNVSAGQLLRFELPDERSHFLGWALRWARQEDAERWTRQAASTSDRSEERPVFELIGEGGPSEGHVAEFLAPPPGDWSVELEWTDDRNDEWGPVATLFRIVVGD